MEAAYWVAFLVGAFFVALSLVGGDHAGGHDAGGHDGVGHGAGAGPGVGPGLVDLLSLRFVFLFAAFFGLTGLVLSAVGAGVLFTPLAAVLVGLVVGLGGNVAIRRIAGAKVSSAVEAGDLAGTTARVVLPFEPGSRGKVSVVAKGSRLTLVARAFEDAEPFARGDEVVIVRMNGSTAEVVRPGGALPARRADPLALP